MKFSLLIIALFVASCASDSGKKMEEEAKMKAKAEQSKVEAKVEKAKEEAKKVVEDKKDMLKEKKEMVAASMGMKTCSMGSTERNVEVKKTDAGCEVLYTKNGETKSVASAQYDMSYCDTVKERIASNLSSAGYKCE